MIDSPLDLLHSITTKLFT